MGLTARPSKTTDLAKIDEIQSEFFDDKPGKISITKETETIAENTPSKSAAVKENRAAKTKTAKQKLKEEKTKAKITEQPQKVQIDLPAAEEIEQGSRTIADLLATAKFEGIRHTSRPYTVPRSLTIDLTRLKSKFRSRDLQYTQNELMDKMVKESLEIINADNFQELRERAFEFVKSPDQCSRRSVTLTEETALEMNELKADLALKHNRRFSADEIFTALLAIAFAPLYENELI